MCVTYVVKQLSSKLSMSVTCVVKYVSLICVTCVVKELSSKLSMCVTSVVKEMAGIEP